MDYRSNQPMMHQQQQLPATKSLFPGALELPDASSSSEKALMWSQQQQQYMIDSGFSTQAPSVSGTDAFLDTDEPENAVRVNELSIQPQQPVLPAQQTEWAPQSQMPPAQQEMINAEAAEDVNALANWMKNRDDAEMAMKAIPEMLDLLLDEDQVVVREAALCFKLMALNAGPCFSLISFPNAIPRIVNCINRSPDVETVSSLVGTLFCVSSHRPHGVDAIIKSGALIPLLNLISATHVVPENLISFAITTIHYVLVDCKDSVKHQIRQHKAVESMVSLLKYTGNVKFLSIVTDCLNCLTHSHPETKKLIMEAEGTAILVDLLNNCQYNKLTLNITRLVKALSVCQMNKKALINYNVIQIMTCHLNTPNTDILHNMLIAIRNLSDSATRLSDLEPLIQFLSSFMSSSQDIANLILAAGILSNLTCNNEVNKKCVLKMGLVNVLLGLISSYGCKKTHALIEPCVCILRNLTNKHSETLLVHEQIRTCNGIEVINTLFGANNPYNWPIIKAALGLTRNLAGNQLNAHQMRHFNTIQSLTQIFYDAYMLVYQAQNRDPTKVNNVSLLDIIDLAATGLHLLAKDYQNQLQMRDLECIKFFGQVFCDTRLPTVQKASATLLAELSTSRECAQVIEATPAIHAYIQASMCNRQTGALMTIAELGSPNTVATSMLQSVATMIQRLQEHRSQFMMPHQHQQQQQRAHFQQQMPQQQQSIGVYGQPQQTVYYNGQVPPQGEHSSCFY